MSDKAHMGPPCHPEAQWVLRPGSSINEVSSAVCSICGSDNRGRGHLTSAQESAQSTLIATLRNHVSKLERERREINIAIEQCAQVALQYHATPIADAIRRRFIQE